MSQQEALVRMFRKSGWFIDFLQSTIYVDLSFLDVDDVKFVINYDFPGAVEDYIHRSSLWGFLAPSSNFLVLAIASLYLQSVNLFSIRIGRTGRKGNTGTAYTFFTQKNSKNAEQLINILTEAKQVNHFR